MPSVLPYTQPFVARIDLPVRTYDIDFNGHVSNIVYIRWLEDMRNTNFDKIMGLQTCFEQGYMAVLISTNINYKREINLFDKPYGMIWVKSYSRTSFTYREEIFVDDKLCAEANQVVVFLDRTTGRPVRLPQILQEKFVANNVEKDY
jgi:acyl-CoA thioester hydrolase